MDRYVYCIKSGSSRTGIIDGGRLRDIVKLAKRHRGRILRMSRAAYRDPSGAKYGWDWPTFDMCAECIADYREHAQPAD